MVAIAESGHGEGGLAGARSSALPTSMAMAELRMREGRGRRRSPWALGFTGALTNPSARCGAMVGGGGVEEDGQGARRLWMGRRRRGAGARRRRTGQQERSAAAGRKKGCERVTCRSLIASIFLLTYKYF